MDALTNNSTIGNEAQNDAVNEVPKPIGAIIHISIEDQGIRAYLEIEPPINGGAAATFEAIQSEVLKHEITHNVNVETLKDLAANPIYNKRILIARGSLPVDGLDGIVEFNIKSEKTPLKPKIGVDDTADYHDLGIVENVAQGQVLCNITLPTDGAPGITVQGKELQQKKGRPVKSLVGRNTELTEDGTEIISQISGQVQFDGRKINVDETFRVKENVDFSTGDIKVNGNVIIPGMVLPGFKIEATGNVEIKGAVENASIKAGGDVKLQRGFINSNLYCSGNLKCRYIENSKIFVKYDIKTESIINSDVKCGKSIKVTGSIAKILGGKCFAGDNIEARSIGSMSHVNTSLKIGTDETVIERQQELVTKISGLEETNKKLDSIISILHQLEMGNRLTPENREVLEQTNFSYHSNNREIEEAKQELEEINQSIREKSDGRIICFGDIYPGTKIEICGAVLYVDQTKENVMLYNKDGEICTGKTR